METPNQNVLTALEAKPHRVLLVSCEHAGQIRLNTGEAARHTGRSITERSDVVPSAQLIRHEAKTPRVATVMEPWEPKDRSIRPDIRYAEFHGPIRVRIFGRI